MKGLRSRRAGFTLIEAMVTVAIMGILATMAGMGLMYGSRRARMNNASFEVAAMLSVAQMRATTAGHPQYVVFWQSNELEDGTYPSGVYRFERDETALPALDAPADWTALTVTKAGINVQDDLAASPSWDHLRFGAGGAMSTSYRGIAFRDVNNQKTRDFPSGLPAPFNSITLKPLLGSATPPLATGSTFTASATGGKVAVIRFDPDGRVTLPTATSPDVTTGGALVLGEVDTTQPTVRWVVVSSPSGLVKVY